LVLLFASIHMQHILYNLHGTIHAHIHASSLALSNWEQLNTPSIVL